MFSVLQAAEPAGHVQKKPPKHSSAGRSMSGYTSNTQLLNTPFLTVVFACCKVLGSNTLVSFFSGRANISKCVQICETKNYLIKFTAHKSKKAL